MEWPEVVVGELGEDEYPFRSVEIYPRQRLGRGAYGFVCRAKCDDLPCAAKLIHSIFLSDPGVESLLRKFTEECRILSSLTHPNIVQFLGVAHLPGEQKAPVQLTELMDESLTTFIARSRDTTTPIPYHIEVTFVSDVAFAISYLHSRGIIHRDLSSNNVLLLAGQRAKVTDFGVAKLKDLQNQFQTPTFMTYTPGTPVFMPPEARFHPLRYTNKLDIFSWGVICLHLLSLTEPHPGDEFVETSQSQLKRVPEHQRREDDIAKIAEDHPIRPITLSCLEDDQDKRPSASILCTILENLKRGQRYLSSREKMQGEKEALMDEVFQLREQVKELQQKEPATEMDKSHRQVETLEQVELLKKENLKLLEEARQKDALICQLKEQISKHSSPQPSWAFDRINSSPFTWRCVVKTPCSFTQGSTAVIGTKAYFSRTFSGVVHVFDSRDQSWSALPECPKEEFTLASINSKVVAVGGVVREVGKAKISAEKSVLCLDLSRGSDANWEHYPAMFYGRILPAAASSDSYLLVAGGLDAPYHGKAMDTVEIFSASQKQWYTAYRLPKPIASPSMTVCGEYVYILSSSVGKDRSESGSVYFYKIKDLYDYSNRLITPTAVRQTWQLLPSVVNLTQPQILVIAQELHVVGREEVQSGRKHSVCHWQVSKYNSDSFSPISVVPGNCGPCLAAVVDTDVLVVATRSETLVAELTT